MGNVVPNQFGPGIDYVQVMNKQYGVQNQSVDDIAYDSRGNLYGVGDILIGGVKKG